MKFAAVFVDDMVVFDVDEISLQELLAKLGKWIHIKDKGVSEWFLGIKTQVVEKRIILSQERHVQILIEKWNMQICKPIYEHVGIFKNATDDKSLTDHFLFQQLVGALFNSALTIKPDTAFTVKMLSQACKSPTVQNFIGAERILRFLKCMNHSLTYSRHDRHLGNFAHSNSDRAGDVTSRKSVSGMVFKND